MRIRSWSLLALALVALTQLSCATMGLTPLQDSMPAARAALPPEYRLFYDALQDYGDWTLIEPYGYVFRPNVSLAGWRPYQYGYWAPSDVYGWVWISAEPFGWATYHYGDWLYDRYQGWVWIPGLDWGPAWVSWEQSADYIGWAPMFPPGATPDAIPGGGYLFVSVPELPSTDVATRVKTQEQLGDRLVSPWPVTRTVEHGGVKYSAGPRYSDVEKHVGTLPRVRIEDAIARTGPGGRSGPRPGREAPAVQRPGARSAPAENADETARVEAMRRAAEEAARQARSVTESKGAPPSSIGVVRPEVRRENAPGAKPSDEATPGRPRDHENAGADSTKKW